MPLSANVELSGVFHVCWSDLLDFYTRRLKMDWTEAMIELNGLLETIRDETNVTKEEVLKEVDNVFEK